MARSYISQTAQAKVPQSEPYREDQVKNAAGGYTWEVDPWIQLRRWLILGSESGTYYVNERDLTKMNLKVIDYCLQEDARRVVDEVVRVFSQRLAGKQDPVLYTLARCMKCDDPGARRVAQAIPGDLSFHFTGYHILRLADFLRTYRVANGKEGAIGAGRGTKRALATWFMNLKVRDLAYEATKYKQREGWSMADLLRQVHPVPENEERRAVFKWIVDDEYVDFGRLVPELDPIWGYRDVRAVADLTVSLLTDDIKDTYIANKIRQFRLVREAVPSELLGKAAVWDALLDDMPMTAMVRNLATLTRLGVIAPLGGRTAEVVGWLGDAERIKRSRIHPIAVLQALLTYREGKGQRGSNVWEPVTSIVDALDQAFYAAFQNAEPTGKRLLVAVDVSGSMQSEVVAGMANMSAARAAIAQALVLLNQEPAGNTVCYAFSDAYALLPLSSRQRLDDAVEVARENPAAGGGTDISLAVQCAIENHHAVDAFIVLTDSMSWSGDRHTADVLLEYRQRFVKDARLINVQMSANRETVADPKDAGVLECVGFDPSTPVAISNWLRGM